MLRPNDIEIWRQIAGIDINLGRIFDLKGKLAEARPLHAESLYYL